MTTSTILSYEAHQHIRVISSRGEEFGDNLHTIPVVVNELRQLSLEYPTCIMKDSQTGQFGLYALTGFEKGENLFLSGNKWLVDYVPIHIQRQPFMIAVNETDESNSEHTKTYVSIQLDHKRVNYSKGEALFDRHGNASDYLQNINKLLSTLYTGLPKTNKFIDALLKNDLLVQQQLNINLDAGKHRLFQGLYSINEENLNKLDENALAQLHKEGYLKWCYFMLSSLGHLQKLTKLKQDKMTNN